MRRKAVAAATVAVLLFGGGVGLYGVFVGFGDPTLGSLPSRPRRTVWPENALSRENATQVQARADAGEADLEWRLRPTTVVERFANDVLGWSHVRLSEFAKDNPDGSVDLTITTTRPCGIPTAPCPSRPAPHLVVSLTQPVEGSGSGIWSVASVTSPYLSLPPSSDASAGQWLAFGLDMPKTSHAVVGLAYANSCGQTDLASDVGIREGAHALEVPDPLFDEPCEGPASGYLFAYTTPQLVVQTGDPLLESASIDDLAMVPITVFAAGASPAPSGVIEGCGDASPNMLLGADGFRFDHSCLSVPARTPSVIGFDNRDGGESHNVAGGPASPSPRGRAPSCSVRRWILGHRPCSTVL